MARMYPLFSSSKGNATFLGTPQGGILIDAGVSSRRLCMALERAGIPVSAVQAVFITHDHSDHIGGLRVFCKQTGVPVYAQPVTAGALPDTADIHVIEGAVTVCGMTVQAFATSHDTAQSCGYTVTMPDGARCAICTDLGLVTETVRAAVTGCRLVLLESNYDEKMLRCGIYPPTLKARIASDRGHLSNIQCGEFARHLVANGTTHLVLGHLSQENNTPACAETAVTQALSGYVRGQDYLLDIAAPESDGRMIVF